MQSVEEALAQILAGVRPLDPEKVALVEAQGRVLARDLVAPFALPPFANTSMDGYAVRSADLAGTSDQQPALLKMVGVVPAGGEFVGELATGTTVRIFTGAPIPAGADAVIQQELTAPSPDGEFIPMLAAIAPGHNIRMAGSDVQAGSLVVARGTELGPAEIAVAAAIGAARVEVTRQPRVAIIGTGDELVEPGQPLGPGQIYNSNALMLAAAVRAAGGVPWVLPTASDTLDDIRAHFTQAQAADLVLSSGGVSVGDFDLVRRVLEEMGQVAFWRVNVRPGKPLAFGRLGATPFMGLPGNPVSSAVTFEIFGRPLLRTLLGCATMQRPAITVRLGSPIARGDRRHYVRAHLQFTEGTIVAQPSGDQSSHRIASLLGAEALLIITEGQGTVAAGEIVPAMLLN